MSNIRAMDGKDVSDVVRIHLEAFPGFFLSFLGGNFLCEFYNSAFLDETKIALIFENQGIQAFAFGTTHSSGFYYRLLRKNWWRFGWASVGALLQKPSILPRLLRAFTMPRQELPVPNCATLNPFYQGQGQGKQLIAAFLSDASNRGCRHVNLVTDALDNDFINAFYCKTGFTLFRTFKTPEGRLMNEYINTLFPESIP
jgi:GNAT superfamily N-acetyltransferase